ncbi:DNA-protecting protein DprA [Candidatus Parcubacteria bacterium]|nr:MAG: DNA-protecting protein DprA [Candidatus Parcubacteria bacterium]
MGGTEASFYHLCNLALKGNYSALAAIFTRHQSWEQSWKLECRKLPDAPQDPSAELRKLADHSVTILLPSAADYPDPLKEIPQPPHGIYVRGKIPDSSMPWVAIVGTRKATAEGRAAAHYFAAELARQGICVVSGLALGIDGAAHQGALEGGGATVAVLACGLDRVYPSSHTALARELLRGCGALISEYPPGQPPLPHLFLARNRIIAGLAAATLVVEAPRKSGSLVTAYFALEANRDVGVVPGPYRHPHYQGSHDLIKKGAVLVDSPSDILELLHIAPSPQPGSPSAKKGNFSDEEQAVLSYLSQCAMPVNVDKIIRATTLNAKTATYALSLLVVKGIVQEAQGTYFLSPRGKAEEV